MLQPAGLGELLAGEEEAALAEGVHRNKATASPAVAETFNFKTALGSTSSRLQLGQWTPVEELFAGVDGPAALENPHFRGLLHRLLTRDGFAVLRPETLSALAEDGGGGLERLIQLIFQDTRASVVPVFLAWGSTYYARDGSTKVLEFHVDELPTTSKSRDRLLVNVWIPHSVPLHLRLRRSAAPGAGRGSSAASEQFSASEMEALREAQEALGSGPPGGQKRLAIVRGSAFAEVAETELRKLNGPGPLEGRAMIRVHECLSSEAADLLLRSGDVAVSPPDACVVFLSGTSSHTERVPICPHAGALEGLSDEHRFYVYPAQ